MKRSIIKTVLLQLGGVFLLSIVLIGSFWISSEYDNLDLENERYRAQFIENQKSILRSEVLKVRDFLMYEKQSAEKRLQQQLKQRVDEAHAVASHLYQNQTQRLQLPSLVSPHPESGITDALDPESRILESLRPLSFNQGRGFLHIHTLDGTVRLYPPAPERENLHYSLVPDSQMGGMSDLLREAAESGHAGVYQHFAIDSAQGDGTPRLRYFRLFEPYGWIIAAEDSLEAAALASREDIFKRIAGITYGANNEGYFFINSYSGDLFVTNGKYFAGERNIWEATDLNGKKVVQENARLAQSQPEGGFSTYVWEKNTGIEAAKISFIIGMDEWQIFIGSGAYIDTIEEEIRQREEDLLARLKTRVISTLTLLLLTFVLLGLVAYYVAKRLSFDFSMFLKVFETAANERVHIDADQVAFKEFRVLAKRSNSMIDALNLQSERLKQLAFHDHLTTLPNRVHGMTQLTRMITRARENGSILGLLFIDIDDFKVINDSLGHTVGDRLLKIISDRLSYAVREEDTVARLGGDEFMVITGMLNDPADAGVIARDLLNVLQEPFQIDHESLHISASIGICIFPDDGEDAETLLRNADSAMYQAKGLGKCNFRYYHIELTERTQQRAALLNDLRHAIEREELELYFQPQIDIHQSRCRGVEVLLRWQHPEKGLIRPDEFIPIAESSGQIVQIGEWVLSRACECLSRWRSGGYPLEFIAVNISARQIQELSLTQTINRILEQTRLPPQALELEITESVVMDLDEPVIQELVCLKKLGLGLSVDDFGTGYSSLSSLKKLPIDKIKIDRSFVSDLEIDENDLAIVKAVISMGNSLALTIVAEGVESKSQETLLIAEGCDLVQGHYYAEALSERELLMIVQDWEDEVVQITRAAERMAE